MTDEQQARLEARARIDIKNLYARGPASSKDSVAAFRHVKFVWLGRLTDFRLTSLSVRKSASWKLQESIPPRSDETTLL
jgi:hypothetical protein